MCHVFISCDKLTESSCRCVSDLASIKAKTYRIEQFGNMTMDFIISTEENVRFLINQANSMGYNPCIINNCIHTHLSTSRVVLSDTLFSIWQKPTSVKFESLNLQHTHY